MAFAPAYAIPKTPSRGVRFPPCRLDAPRGVSPRRGTGWPCVQAASAGGLQKERAGVSPGPCQLGDDERKHGEQRKVQQHEGGEVHARHLSASASIPASISASISRSFSYHALTASLRP
jgi:hypothetical protein